MYTFKKFLMVSLSLFLTGLLGAEAALSLDSPPASVSVNHSNSAKIDASYQTAFVYFLPDYKDSEIDGDNDHNREYCRKQGYTHNYKNCASPRILKDRCPVGNYYKQCYCAGSPSCTGSKSSSNPYPTSTGASMTSCVDCPGNTLYTWTCSSSTCASYQISGSCPSRGYCSQCCDGYYKLDSCQSGYHIEGSGSSATCVLTCVPAANETGCSYGTETCSDGCGGTRTCCKACTDTCSSKGYYSSKPSGKTCSTTTVCGSTCYYNCQDTHTHSYSCPSGYSETNSWGSSARTTGKVCSCGGTSGTCYAAPACTPLSSETSCSAGYSLASGCDDGCGGTRSCCIACDPEDRDCQCPGKVYCDPDTKVGDGATCTAGSKTFYERCLVKETCDRSSYDESDGYCTTSTGSAWSEVYYVKDKCTTQKGTTYKYYGSCTGYSTNSYKDCAGNVAPCKGMVTCDGDVGEGTACECGGKKYFEKCKEDECNTDNMYTDGSSVSSGYCWAYIGEGRKNNGGYYYVKDKCTKANGDLVYGYMSCDSNLKDCNGNYPPCYGKKECPDDAGTGLCECGGKKYFTECSDSCTYGWQKDYISGAGWQNSALETDSRFTSGGDYKVAHKCDRKDGTGVYYYESCTSTSKDMSGNYGPCKGYKSSCGSGYKLGGTKCSCGGKYYWSDCLTECNYEDTAESCAAQGKEFESKCHGDGKDENEWIWYGECK